MNTEMSNKEFWHLLGTAITCFLAGLAAYQAVLEMAHLEVATERSSCAEKKVALRVEAYPSNSNIKIYDSNTNYYQGMCLKQGRYQLVVSADKYKTEKRVIQLGAADYVSLFNLNPVDIVNITEPERLSSEKFGYTGERVSLNFQEIDVRAVLQVLSDFTALNMAISEDVSGPITIKLKNVPWDQALDAILTTKNLIKINKGGVMHIYNKPINKIEKKKNAFSPDKKNI